LADLTQSTITQYIEEIWLKQTGKSLTIDELTQQKHQIWLLLDGLDEMTSRVETRHVSALLGGWVQDARVVVTCRVNVWEADKNAFSGFDVFRNLEFNPEQVRDYIRRWFAAIRDAPTGESLEVALAESENSRLKELIQNPLRLWMLCQIWQTGGGLPETQAGLYAQFVDWVYRWKVDEEILDQREAIDTALARLALAAMEQKDEVSRLRLRESWVLKVLGSRPIFQAVMKLPWLNRVERSPEAICVFYHATFQEYFAALAVDDWDYFLPRNHVNFPVAAKAYRIFEPQWKQVILLWLGRGDVVKTERETKELKEKFIQALVEFKDGCKDFYGYRAYFLAAAGINEFKTCSLASDIVKQVVECGFVSFSIKKQEWRASRYPIEKGARKAIPETIRQLAITELIQIIENCQKEGTRWRAAESLGEIDPGNPKAIAALIKILETTNNKYAYNWARIDQGNPKAIAALISILETTEDEDTRRRVAYSLGEIDQGNPKAIAALISILETTEDEDTRRQVAYSLGKIGQGNPQAIAALISILETTEDEDTRRQAPESLGKIGQGNPQAIAALIKILETTEDKYTRWQAAESLGKIRQGNPQAIAALIKILETTDNDEYTRWQAAESLGKIYPGNPQAITGLIRILENTDNDEDTRWRAVESLGEIDPGNPQAIAALIKILENTDNKYTRWQAAESLGKIRQGNPQAIAGLIRILETIDNEDTRWRAAESLGKIDPGNPQAIAGLIRILETTDNEDTRWRAAESLGKIDPGNPQAIAGLIRILETTDNEDTRWRAAESLGKIDPGNPQAIAGLIRILETTDNEDMGWWRPAKSLGKIGQGNPQAIAAFIRILETTDNEITRWRAAESLEEILTTPEQYADVVSALTDCLSDKVYPNNFGLVDNCYTVVWDCAANLPYPEFYRAWHGVTEN
jgi:HEAT repeat protein